MMHGTHKVKFIYKPFVVGLAIPYRMDGSIFESRWGQLNFFSPYPSRPALESTQPSLPELPRIFSVVKRQWHSVDPPRLSRADIRNQLSCNSVPPLCLLGTSQEEINALCFSYYFKYLIIKIILKFNYVICVNKMYLNIIFYKVL